MFYNAVSLILKFVLCAVLIGAILNEFNISAESILYRIGFTPQAIMEVLQEGVVWALPHFLLGALIMIPIWVVLFLLKPPRL